MRDVTIIGAGMGSRWGKYSGSLIEMMAEASLSAIDDAGTDEIDAVFVANMGAGRINNQTALGSALIDYLNLFPAVGASIENGPASGATAARIGYMAIASGVHDVVMITGGEKMRVAPGPVVTDFVATMAHPEAEYIHGITFPSLGALLARLYFEKYGVTSEDLARIAIKNHQNGLKNPHAHIRQKITMEGILTSREAKLNNPMIADPLHLYDMCPVSDGSASIIMCSMNKVQEFEKTPIIKFAGTGQGMDTMAVHEREDPTFLKAVKIASDQAFKMAGLTREDIDFAEIHDAFEILELAELESAGFYERGKAHLSVREGETELTGKFPVNTSGGLKARGHPVGATGVAQLCELVWQLRGEAGERQIPNDPKHGYAVNFGGFGNNVVSTILSRVKG
ncbi:acetyl-CoA acetyltransferase [Candidatus Heimdallarchaeota archaeon B3_Heim]|nr:MAG: acetyl-CoA acetyltransferase [Candidatus Heimdallarchaeota archaeon B3_Heim]